MMHKGVLFDTRAKISKLHATIVCYATYTLKTGIPVEEGDSILKLLWRVSRPEIQLGVGMYSEPCYLTILAIGESGHPKYPCVRLAFLYRQNFLRV